MLVKGARSKRRNHKVRVTAAVQVIDVGIDIAIHLVTVQIGQTKSHVIG